MTKYGRPSVRRPGVEHRGDVRMVHERQGLPLRLESGDDLARVHAGLDQLERDQAAKRRLLLSEVHHAHPALAEHSSHGVAGNRRP